MCSGYQWWALGIKEYKTGLESHSRLKVDRVRLLGLTRAIKRLFITPTAPPQSYHMSHNAREIFIPSTRGSQSISVQENEPPSMKLVRNGVYNIQ